MATADSRTGHTGRARVGVPRLWAARSSLFMVGLVAVVISVGWDHPVLRAYVQLQR